MDRPINGYGHAPSVTLGFLLQTVAMLTTLGAGFAYMKSDVSNALKISTENQEQIRAAQNQVISLSNEVIRLQEQVKYFREQYEKDMTRYIREPERRGK